MVLLGAEQLVDSFWEAHVFGGVLMLLQARRLQHGAFGVRAPGHGVVAAHILAQTRAVPEQGVVENPVHPVPQRRDRRVLLPVRAGHGGGGGGGRGEGGGRGRRRKLAPQHAGRVFSLVERRGGLRQTPDARLPVQQLLLAARVIVVTRLDLLLLLLPAVRMEVLRVRLETSFAQVLLGPAERSGDGELERGALDELLRRAVGGHVRVQVVPVLQLALGALRLQRLEVLQVAQLQVLLGPTPALCSGSGSREDKQVIEVRQKQCDGCLNITEPLSVHI